MESYRYILGLWPFHWIKFTQPLIVGEHQELIFIFAVLRRKFVRVSSVSCSHKPTSILHHAGRYFGTRPLALQGPSTSYCDMPSWCKFRAWGRIYVLCHLRCQAASSPSADSLAPPFWKSSNYLSCHLHPSFCSSAVSSGGGSSCSTSKAILWNSSSVAVSPSAVLFCGWWIESWCGLGNFLAFLFCCFHLVIFGLSSLHARILDDFIQLQVSSSLCSPCPCHRQCLRPHRSPMLSTTSAFEPVGPISKSFSNAR